MHFFIEAAANLTVALTCRARPIKIWMENMNKNLVCPICSGTCSQLAPVDFNKNCEEAKGKFLKPSGIAVNYSLCPQCGFCFAPELMAWPIEEFAARIYNENYVQVDPEYVQIRPEGNARNLIAMFGDRLKNFKHLDYGGGSGVLANKLRQENWQSTSYDPFVDRDTKIEDLGKFDLITAYEVFEHVPDVHKLMANLHTLLAPNGLILFSTLLSDSDIQPNKPLTWWYAAPRNGHISLFSRDSLGMLGHNSGFKFGSFSRGMHLFFTEIPGWAAHLF